MTSDAGRDRVDVYVPGEQKAQWTAAAADYDVSLSEFVASMVESGRKKFDATVTPRESAEKLRDQRNDLRDEAARLRDRITHLEEQLYRGEPATVTAFVEEQGEATFNQIVTHVRETAPRRIADLLDDLEGETVELDAVTETYTPTSATIAVDGVPVYRVDGRHGGGMVNTDQPGGEHDHAADGPGGQDA